MVTLAPETQIRYASLSAAEHPGDDIMRRQVSRTAWLCFLPLRLSWTTFFFLPLLPLSGSLKTLDGQFPRRRVVWGEMGR